MTDKEDLMLADLRMMLDKPIKIDVWRDEDRVKRWKQAQGWGWVSLSREVDGLIMGAITETGRGHLALQSPVRPDTSGFDPKEWESLGAFNPEQSYPVNSRVYHGEVFAPPRAPEPIEGTISPWIPTQDPIELAVLGKLGEECCELGARLFRTVIQGLDEKDPASQRTNREEISRELADVEAGIQTIKRELGIDYDDARVNGKRNGFLRWFKMIRDRLEYE